MLISAWLMLLAGTAVLVGIGAPWWAKAIGALLWWLDGGLSIARHARNRRHVRALFLAADGRCEVVGRGGARRDAEWHGGSVVTQSWAWVCLRAADGRVHCELILQGRVEQESWRRLQVVWRWGARRRPD